MDIRIEVALIAAVVTAAGWLITHVMQVRREREKESREALLKYTERQLEELYGPLAFLIIEGRRTFHDLLENLGRSQVFAVDGTISPGDLKTWLFWAEHDAIPRNGRIKDLLATKTHLIEGTAMPESYKALLDHHNSWIINHLRWQKEQVPYSWHSKTNYPVEFEREVLLTFSDLKRRHAELVVALGNKSERLTS